MSSLLALRPGPRAWEADAVPYVYSEAGRAQFKAMPGVRWVADRSSPNGRGFYRGPRDAVELVCSTLESAGVCKVREELEEPELASSPHTVIAMPPGLREYQVSGVAWLRWQLRHSGAALLADEMGLGKSAQAIAALESLTRPLEIEKPRTLVICPAIVKPHWEAQIKRWGSDRDPWSVYSYEKFRSAAGKGEIPPGVWACVIDEIQYTANPTAKRTQAITGFLGSQPARPLVIGLSGTPMTARPRDLWQPLELLHPGRWGYKWGFERRYCDGRYEEIEIGGGERRNVWRSDGCSRAEELGIRLSSMMLRRTKRDVGEELPPIERVCLDVELPARARKDLAKAAAAIDWQSRTTEARGGSVSELLSQSESYKLEAAEELAREALAGGHRVLLVTTRKATAKALGQALDAPAVDGDTPIESRRSEIADAPCAVATMFSITTGIDLVGFDVIVFVGLDWVPSTLQQVEARLHRIGQLRSVTAYFLIALGTLDEVVRERVIERLDQFESIVGAGGGELRGALAGGNDEDLIAAMVAALKGKK